MDTRTHPSTGFQRNQRAETIQISSGVKRIPESENLLRAPSGQHIRRVHDPVCVLTYLRRTTVVLTGIVVVVSAIACLYSSVKPRVHKVCRLIARRELYSLCVYSFIFLLEFDPVSGSGLATPDHTKILSSPYPPLFAIPLPESS